MKTISYMVLSCIILCMGCKEKKEEVKEYKYVPPKVDQLPPVKMILSPDGNLYFPESIHRPKSDKDSVVWVSPSVK